MTETARAETDRLRDRLLGEAALRELSLEEIVEVARVIHGSDDGLELYGMGPRAWFSRGCRLAGRTAMECKSDHQATDLGDAIASALRGAGLRGRPCAVVDPFAGSGNVLHHVHRVLGATAGVGYEVSPVVHAFTRENLRRVGSSVTVVHGSLAPSVPPPIPANTLPIVIVDPPWGAGFTFATGLDLARTDPPAPAVMALARASMPSHRAVVFAIVAPDVLHEPSVAALAQDYVLLARGITPRHGESRSLGYLLFRTPD